MTTPTPNTPIEISDVNDELAFSSTATTNFDKNIVRQLTGTASKQGKSTEINLSADLGGKTAFSEIYSISNSNTQNGVAYTDAPINASLLLQANSDLYTPQVDWSWVINPSGSVNVSNNDLTIVKSTLAENRGKNATITLKSFSGTKTANLTVSANLSVDGHSVGTRSKTISLSAQAVNTALQVTAVPSLSVNSTGYAAQTATVTVIASSNSSVGGSLRFTTTRISGTTITPAVQSDRVSFTVTAAQPTTNQTSYSVLTELLINNKVAATNTVVVDLYAQYINRNITFMGTVGGALSNNNFSNNTSQYATLDILAVHDAVAPTFTQGTITFTYEVNGDPITTQIIDSNTSSSTARISLFHDVNVDGFGFKKATVSVLATLRDSLGNQLAGVRLDNLVLRTGAYGYDVNLPQSNTQSGYSAQTAVSKGSFSIRATDATLAVTHRQYNGVGPTISSTTRNISGSTSKEVNVTLASTTPSGKGRTQAITNTSNFELTAKVNYDGVSVFERAYSDILIKTESLPYTFAVGTPDNRTSNIQFSITDSITSSLATTFQHNVPGGSVVLSNDNGAVATVNASSATSATSTVSVVSPAAGGQNVHSVIVSGDLRDSASRTIETISSSQLTVDAATHLLSISGDSRSQSSKTNPQVTSQTFEVSQASFVTTSLSYPPTLTSSVNPAGDPSFSYTDDGLFTYKDTDQKIRIQAVAKMPADNLSGTIVSGTYTITARASYKGIDRNTSKSVTLSSEILPVAIRTFKLTSNATSIIEGSTDGVRFTLDTTFVPNGATIPFTITGVSGSDIDPSSLSGSFTINSNKGTYDLSAKQDFTVENKETLVLALTSNSTNGIPPLSISLDVVDKTTGTIVVSEDVKNAVGFTRPQTGFAVIGASTTDFTGGTIAAQILSSGVAKVERDSPTSPTIKFSVTQSTIGKNTATYEVAYTLKDSNGNLVTEVKETDTISAEVKDTLFTHTVTAGTKTWSFTDYPLNGSGYPYAHPLTATLSQVVDFTAASVNDIPNRKFNFSTTTAFGDPILLSYPSDSVGRLSSSATYTNFGSHFSYGAFTIINKDESVSVTADVRQDNVVVGGPLTRNHRSILTIPNGRIYRLGTYSYGPRMYHTRDFAGNRPPALVDYSLLPSSNYFSGPQVKWLGFHKQGSNFPNITNGAGVIGQLYDPNASTSRPRPLQHVNGLRLYSSESHRAVHNENPNVIIPENYFMVLSFSDTGMPQLGDIFLIGSDHNVYGPLSLYSSREWQNDTARDNDSFNWYIYRARIPAGVTFNYCIISNGFTGYQGINLDTSDPTVIFNPSNLGTIEITDYVNFPLGTVDGGNDGTGTAGGGTDTSGSTSGSGSQGGRDTDYWVYLQNMKKK